MSNTYQSSREYRDQLSNGPTAPKHIAGLHSSGPTYACADRFGDGDFIVSLYAGISAVRLSPADARTMADQLARAAAIADRELKAYKEYTAKPHPTAQRDPIRTGCWIWYTGANPDRPFHYRYTSIGMESGTFKPGTHYTSGPDGTWTGKPDIGFVTPERIDLWTKLAHAAGQEIL